MIETVALGGGLSVVYSMAGPRVLDWTLADTDVESSWHIHPVDLRPARTDEPTIPVLPDRSFRDGHVLLPVGADARPRASTN